MEESLNYKFLEYKTKCETLLTETFNSSKVKTTLLKEEHKTKDLIVIIRLLPTVDNLSSNNCVYNCEHGTRQVKIRQIVSRFES